jgi:ankyrin repeat protein
LIVAVPAHADINSDFPDFAERGDVTAIEVLLKKDADINAKDKYGWNALMI